METSPQDLARPFCSRGFLSRLARRSKRKRDYSQSRVTTLVGDNFCLSLYYQCGRQSQRMPNNKEDREASSKQNEMNSSFCASTPAPQDCKGISQLSLSGTSLYRQYYRGCTVSTKLFREEKDAITKQCKNQQFYFLYLPS